MKTIKIIESLLTSGALSSGGLRGCGSTEMEKLFHHFGCVIPKEYADFMQIGGLSIGNLFIGTDIYYPRVLGLKSEASELMAENGVGELLAKNAIVFSLHQGYEVNYMIPGSPDPVVWQYVEGAEKCVLGCASFSEFLEEAIRAHLKENGTLD